MALNAAAKVSIITLREVCSHCERLSSEVRDHRIVSNLLCIQKMYYIHLCKLFKTKNMKTFIKKSLLILVCISMFVGSVTAAAVPANTVANPLTEEKAIPSVKEMLNSFKSLSRSEKKARFKEVKKELKSYKKLKKEGKEPLADRTLIIILAILIPPLGVYLYEGEINSKFWISLLLTLLFWLPGAIYSLLVVLGEV